MDICKEILKKDLCYNVSPADGIKVNSVASNTEMQSQFDLLSEMKLHNEICEIFNTHYFLCPGGAN